MKNEDLHTITIVKALLSKYGAECVDWEPVVIQKSMYDDFKAAKLNVYKALAGLAVLQNDRFWSDWQTFQFLAQAFNNLMPSAHTVQDLSVAQMMVAVDTANQLRESMESISFVPEFSEEVAKFVASQALNQGVWFLPSPLDFASNYASKTMIQCKDCGNEEYLDDEEDDICPVCSGKYDLTNLGSVSHSSERLKRGFGKNTHIVTKYPTLKVQRALQKLLTGASVNLSEDDQDDVCAARLYTSVRYFLKRREEAKHELDT